MFAGNSDATSPATSKHVAAEGEYEHIDSIHTRVCNLTHPRPSVGGMDEYCFINRCVRTKLFVTQAQ